MLDHVVYPLGPLKLLQLGSHHHQAAQAVSGYGHIGRVCLRGPVGLGPVPAKAGWEGFPKLSLYGPFNTSLSHNMGDFGLVIAGDENGEDRERGKRLF